MAKTRRHFTPEEKYSILQESEREGVTETARKYNLAHSVLNYWKKKYLIKGKDGLKAGYRKVDPQLRSLEEENARLKRMYANLAMELDMAKYIIEKKL